MKERPILFSAPMVRAILDGTKTQTRRVIKPDGKYRLELVAPADGGPSRCPYGQPGGRLWVRETWGVGSRPDPWGGYDGIEYRADQAWLEEGDDLPCHKVQTPEDVCLGDYRSGWKPSIHMPRWASRITLEITGVRVERLQDIAIEDAKAEGAWGPDDSIVQKVADHFDIEIFAANPRNAFQMLWEQINGPGSWEANPWVWVIEFKKVG